MRSKLQRAQKSPRYGKIWGLPKWGAFGRCLSCLTLQPALGMIQQHPMVKSEKVKNDQPETIGL